jgi:rRNA processing protein Gar1
MLKENDPVVIYETGEVGYVEKILGGEGDRLMVRIPHLVAGPIRIMFM